MWYDNVHIRKTNNPVPSERQLNISYNAFKSPVSIEETGVAKIDFTYNGSNDRSAMYYGGFQNDKFQRQYRKNYSADGTMEIKYNIVTGETEFITYIGGVAYTAPVVSKSDGTTQEYLYLHRDYQGSILAITNQARTVVEKRLFDAWGNTVKIQDALGNNLSSFAVLDRGYTGHEHLQSVALIHMNGRLYDAKLHRFLQPDNFVQEPYNTQNYNRYGYVLNNPLKYTDVSGEEFISLTAAVIIGAVIAATTYTLTALTTATPFTAGGLLKATFIGAVSGAITSGIGSAFGNICQFGVKLTYSALAHGMAQGMMSGVQGGNFWTGFASGALSSIASSAWGGGYINKTDHVWKGMGGAWGSGDFGTIAFGTVSGGAGAALTGGNFWQGAATGLTVSLLNHVAHSWQTNRDINRRIIDAGYNPYESANFDNAGVKEFMAKVFPEMYAEANNPDFEIVDNLKNTKLENISGKAEISTIRNAVTGLYKTFFTGLIKLDSSTLFSHHGLAATGGHELSHAADAVSGRWSNWANSTNTIKEKAHSEVRAYQWELDNGSLFYNTKEHNLYLNILNR